MNKKVFTLIVSLLLTGTLASYAGEPTKKKNIIKWNIAELAKPTTSFTICYERVFTKTFTMQANISMFGFKSKQTLGPDSTGVSFTGDMSVNEFGIGLEGRFYIQQHAPTGFYVGPYITSRGYNFHMPGITSTGISATLDDKINFGAFGVVVGYQFLFGDIFSLDITSGYGFISAKQDAPIATLSDGSKFTVASGVNSASTSTPIFGLSLGVAF